MLLMFPYKKGRGVVQPGVDNGDPGVNGVDPTGKQEEGVMHHSKVYLKVMLTAHCTSEIRLLSSPVQSIT